MVERDYRVKDEDTLTGLFGANAWTQGTRDHGKLKGHPVYELFQKSFRAIHRIGEYANVPAGEILLMISIQFGFTLDTCPWFRMKEVYYFVKENIETRYKILYPELNVYLLQTGYYDKSSTAIAPKPVIGQTFEILGDMMKRGASTEEFKKFGIELGKL